MGKSIIKQTKVGSVQSLDSDEVKQATQASYAQRGDEFYLRNENKKTTRKLEKTATQKSPQQSRYKLLKEQNDKTRQRLKHTENAGIRAGVKRSEEKDTGVLAQRKRLQGASTSTKTAQQDVQRQLVKLQRKCHHKFNKTTGRCELCDKHRSAHI